MGDQGQALKAGVALLERAIDYTLGSLRIVTPATLCRPTPCRGWTLQHLLGHLSTSLHTLMEAASDHIPFVQWSHHPQTPLRPQSPHDPQPRNGPLPPRRPHRLQKSCHPHMPRQTGKPRHPATAGTQEGGNPALLPNPALLLRDDATKVLGLWTAKLTDDHPISVNDHRLTSPMVAAVGAIEIAVHGWDIARSCGDRHPIPAAMADELLDLAHLFVTDADRPTRFAHPLTVPTNASPQDHLLAYLGRDPNWAA
ncbi:maleylpyruvate isomerase N-terminal domain-containing protein [Nonomuraea purpurea]|uniref:Maleylpyruvate isomerase N-terminal domain-containing protein n=1 Tax=Nonomuraea purpurea TaxID=1849276 RepID=A0ABV8GHN7_9ACTN